MVSTEREKNSDTYNTRSTAKQENDGKNHIKTCSSLWNSQFLMYAFRPNIGLKLRANERETEKSNANKWNNSQRKRCSRAAKEVVTPQEKLRNSKRVWNTQRKSSVVRRGHNSISSQVCMSDADLLQNCYLFTNVTFKACCFCSLFYGRRWDMRFIWTL